VYLTSNKVQPDSKGSSNAAKKFHYDHFVSPVHWIPHPTFVSKKRCSIPSAGRHSGHDWKSLICQCGLQKIPESSDGVYGCNALIRFKSSKQEKKNVTCEIGVVGRSDRVENDLVFGTPHRMLLRALKVLGFNPGHLEALLLFGENPGLGHQEYNNPLTHPPNNPLHLTELVLDHMELNRVSPTIFTSFVVSSLRKLRLKECTYLPSLLHHFISSGHTISITVLEIEVYDYKESAHESDSQGPLQQLKSFLTSFSTLHKFHLGIASMWPMDYIWRQLQSHKDLESCTIFVVGRGMNFWNVREMCTAHPMLKTLGHPVYNIRNALQGKQLPPDTVKDIRKLASEVVKSNQLEHWRLICEKPHVKVWSPDPYIHDGVHHHAAEALAKIMHQSCCQAAGRIGACRIRRISVSVITHRHMKKKCASRHGTRDFRFLLPIHLKVISKFSDERTIAKYRRRYPRNSSRPRRPSGTFCTIPAQFRRRCKLLSLWLMRRVSCSAKPCV
jgi:hypothetical protein